MRVGKGGWAGLAAATVLLAGLASRSPAGNAAEAEKPSPKGDHAAPAALPEAAAEGPARTTRRGQWIRIAGPIDHATVVRVEQTIRRGLGAAEGARIVFVLEFDAAPTTRDGGQGTWFGDAYELAKFLADERLNAAITVAYIPHALRGHGVLVALACDQIVMASAATLGDAGADAKTIDATMLAAYQEIPRGRHTMPAAVALGMLDRSREVLRVTTEISTEYIAPGQLKELEREHPSVATERIKAADEPWQFSGAEGRKWGLIGCLAEDPRQVVRALDLSPSILEGDPSGAGGWQAIRVELRGNVTADKISQIQRTLEERMQAGANFFCLWIDSPGGSPADSFQLADTLSKLDRNNVRTVAYIPDKALADAAVIAMACDQIVMGPEAKLGGAGAPVISPDDTAQYRKTIRDELARQKMRPWSLWAALIDPDVEVYRCTRLGEVEYFCDEELNGQQPNLRQAGQPRWEKHELVTRPGRPLQLKGREALDYRVAAAVVDGFPQFKEHYGLEDDPTLVEPGWADRLARFLGSNEMAALLLIVGALALYIELHAPGLGIGGFVALVCFALFFWSHYLEGTAGWLEVTLFATGVVCILLELFVLPGFGIFGLGGGGLLLLSLILATQTTWLPRNDYQLAQLERSLLTLAVAIGGVIGAALVLRRWAPRAPVLQHVFLPPPEGEEAALISRREMLVDLGNLVGRIGVAATPLTPGGKARFGNHLVDVVGTEFAARGAEVVVTEVHGNRVFVRPAEEQS
jgi:membrane-bound ClpP family serine protease